MTKRKSTTLTVTLSDDLRFQNVLRRAKKQLPSGLRAIVSFFAVFAAKRICLKIQKKHKIKRIYLKRTSVINNKTTET